MSKRKLKLAALFISLLSFNTRAATIELVPIGSTSITIGESVTFEIWADFSDVGGTIGGGFDVFYDSSVLLYNDDFVFSSTFGADSSISRVGDNCFSSLVTGCGSINEVNGISPNNFTGMANSLSLMGTFSFAGIKPAVATLTMGDNDYPAGMWYNNSTYSVVLPDYLGATIQVSAVPLPSAAWLFLSGLLGFVSITKKKQKTLDLFV